MYTTLAILFFLLMVVLAWRRFQPAVGFLILLLPAYLIRFNFGPLPSTLLEITFGAIFLVWLIRYFRSDWPIIKETISRHKFLFAAIALLIMATLIAAFANPVPLKALGIWRAYFLEPVLLFFVLVGRQKEIPALDLIKYLAWSTVSVSVLAVIQKLTGQLYPPSLWDDQLFGRPTAFFTSPNDIGLFIAPILLLATALFKPRDKQRNNYYIIAVLALLAVFFSFSQGAWVALGAGAVLFAYLVGYKKAAATIATLGIITALVIPQIRTAVLFQDQAGQNRLTLWSYSAEYLTKSPANFILGSGLRRFFTEVQQPYYNVQEMERLIYPHNIFLNFWLETGLLGLLSFSGILIYLFYLGAKTMKENPWLGAAIIGALIVFTVHGLVDVPYFKNDLSMLFWLIAAVALLAFRETQKNKNASH